MSRTIAEAELRGLCGILEVQVKTDRQDIEKLWEAVEALRQQSNRPDMPVAAEQIAQLRQLAEQARAANDELAKLAIAHREDVLTLRTQFQEHVKQYEKWDARRWGLIGVFVASLLSLAANLIVIALRTPTK